MSTTLAASFSRMNPTDLANLILPVSSQIAQKQQNGQHWGDSSSGNVSSFAATIGSNAATAVGGGSGSESFQYQLVQASVEAKLRQHTLLLELLDATVSFIIIACKLLYHLFRLTF